MLTCWRGRVGMQPFGTGDKSAASEEDGVAVGVLGQCVVGRGNDRRPLTGRLAAVLAVLVSTAPRWISQAELLEAAFADAQPPPTPSALHQAVRRLRVRLGPDADLLDSSAAGYRVWRDRRIDVVAMEELAKAAVAHFDNGRLSEGTEMAAAALDLSRGRPYDGLEDLEPLLAASRHAADIQIELLERAARESLGGAPSRWLPRLRAACEREPYRERLWGITAQSEAADGRTVDAVRTVQELRSNLIEVGMELSAELQAIEAELFGAANRSSSGSTASARPQEDGAEAFSSLWAIEMHGRTRSLERALRFLRADGPRVFAGIGEAGSGKSLLVAHLVREAQRSGLRIAAHAFAASDPLSRVGAIDIDHGADLVVFEDLHWATGLELGQVAERMINPDSRSAVVLTARPGEGNWSAWLDRLRPHCVAMVEELGPLDLTAVGSMITGSALAGRVPDQLIQALTNGNPFLISELIRSFERTGILPDRAPLEGMAASVLRARIVAQPAAVVELLEWLAVIEGPTQAAPLSALLGRPPVEVATAIDEALHARLVRELGPGTVQLSHELLRFELLAGMSATRRAAMHGAVADALSITEGGEAELVLRQRLAQGSGERVIEASEACLALSAQALDAKRWVHALDLADRADDLLAGAAEDETDLERLRRCEFRAAVVRATASEALNKLVEVRLAVVNALRNAEERDATSDVIEAGKLSLLALSPGEPLEDAIDALQTGATAAPSTAERLVLRAFAAAHAVCRPNRAAVAAAQDEMDDLRAELDQLGLEIEPDAVDSIVQSAILTSQGLPTATDQLTLCSWRVSLHSGASAARLNALFHRIPRHLALGDRPAAETDLDEAVNLAGRLGHRDYLVTTSQLRASIALADGDVTAATSHIGAALSLGRDHPLNEELSLIIYWWITVQQDPASVLDVALDFVAANPHRPAMGAMSAFNLLRTDHVDDARRELERLMPDPGGEPAFPSDMIHPIASAGLLLVATELGDLDRTRSLVDVVSRHSGTLLWAVGLGFPLGAADSIAGRGLAALGEVDAAYDSFTAGHALEAGFGATALAAQTAEQLAALPSI